MFIPRRKLHLLHALRFNGGSGSGGAGGGQAGGGQAGSGQGGQGSGGQGDGGGQGGGSTGDPKVFDEAYVKQLRAEAAENRRKAKEAEERAQQQQREFQERLLKSLGLEPDPNKNWEKQLEEAKAAAQAATQKANQKLIRAEVKVIAKDLGIVDPDAAFALADLSKVQVGDDGEISGVKEALETLVKAKPYLVGKPPTGGGVGAGSNPPGAGGNGTPTFTRAQIKAMSPEEVEKNWPAIMKQMEAGTLK